MRGGAARRERGRAVPSLLARTVGGEAKRTGGDERLEPGEVVQEEPCEGGGVPGRGRDDGGRTGAEGEDTGALHEGPAECEGVALQEGAVPVPAAAEAQQPVQRRWGRETGRGAGLRAAEEREGRDPRGGGDEASLGIAGRLVDEGVEGLGAGEARQVTGLPGGGDHAGLGRVEHEDVVEVARGEAPLERRGVEVALDVVVGEKHLGVLIHEGVGGGGHDRVVEVGPRAPEHREGHGLPCLGPGGVGDEGLGVPRAADGRRRCQGEAHGAQERPPRTRHGTPSRLLTPYFRFHVKSSPIIAARGRIVATSSAVINGSTRRRPTVRD